MIDKDIALKEVVELYSIFPEFFLAENENSRGFEHWLLKQEGIPFRPLLRGIAFILKKFPMNDDEILKVNNIGVNQFDHQVERYRNALKKIYAATTSVEKEKEYMENFKEIIAREVTFSKDEAEVLDMLSGRKLLGISTTPNSISAYIYVNRDKILWAIKSWFDYLDKGKYRAKIYPDPNFFKNIFINRAYRYSAVIYAATNLFMNRDMIFEIECLDETDPPRKFKKEVDTIIRPFTKSNDATNEFVPQSSESKDSDSDFGSHSDSDSGSDSDSNPDYDSDSGSDSDSNPDYDSDLEETHSDLEVITSYSEFSDLEETRSETDFITSNSGYSTDSDEEISELAGVADKKNTPLHPLADFPYQKLLPIIQETVAGLADVKSQELGVKYTTFLTEKFNQINPYTDYYGDQIYQVYIESIHELATSPDYSEEIRQSLIEPLITNVEKIFTTFPKRPSSQIGNLSHELIVTLAPLVEMNSMTKTFSAPRLLFLEIMIMLHSIDENNNNVLSAIKKEFEDLNKNISRGSSLFNPNQAIKDTIDNCLAKIDNLEQIQNKAQTKSNYKG